MADLPQIILSAAVEGDLDETALRRLLAEADLLIGKVYGKAGKDELRNRIQGYNDAARRTPWIVLVDLDREAKTPAQNGSPSRYVVLTADTAGWISIPRAGSPYEGLNADPTGSP